MEKNNLTDTELEIMLKRATVPVLPPGFADRLQAKLELPAAGTIIAFPQKTPQPAMSRRIWLSAIPLAASLAVGLYLGVQGIGTDGLTGFNASLVSDAADPVFVVGIEDTESFVNGDFS